MNQMFQHLCARNLCLVQCHANTSKTCGHQAFESCQVMSNIALELITHTKEVVICLFKKCGTTFVAGAICRFYDPYGKFISDDMLEIFDIQRTLRL